MYKRQEAPKQQFFPCKNIVGADILPAFFWRIPSTSIFLSSSILPMTSLTLPWFALRFFDSAFYLIFVHNFLRKFHFKQWVAHGIIPLMRLCITLCVETGLICAAAHINENKWVHYKQHGKFQNRLHHFLSNNKWLTEPKMLSISFCRSLCTTPHRQYQILPLGCK
mgnify:FL=1